MSFCNRWIALVWVYVAVVLALGTAAMAQSRTEIVRFPAGFSSTVLDDTIFARETVDYKIGAQAGQRLSVSLTSSNPGVSMDVFLGGSVTADFVGRVSGGSYSTRLRKSGDQIIRVQLERSAAQRGEIADFRLNVSVTGAPTQPVPVPTPTPKPLPTDRAFWEVSGLRPNDMLNMRSGPGTNFRILDTLANGTVLRNFGCAVTDGGSRWCEVSRTARGAQSGWVSSRYLVAVGQVPPAPTPPPAPKPAPPQSARVKCSIILPIFDRNCDARAVYDGSVVQLTLTYPGAATKRNLILKDGAFSSLERETISAQPLGSQYLIVLGDSDYYLVPASLLQRN